LAWKERGVGLRKTQRCDPALKAPDASILIALLDAVEVQAIGRGKEALEQAL
jgi:hypothetical protein